jgi:hypothetical protein
MLRIPVTFAVGLIFCGMFDGSTAAGQTVEPRVIATDTVIVSQHVPFSVQSYSIRCQPDPQMPHAPTPDVPLSLMPRVHTPRIVPPVPMPNPCATPVDGSTRIARPVKITPVPLPSERQ